MKWNRHLVKRTQLYPQKITEWCGFPVGGVIRPFFFVDENYRHVTVNGKRYSDMQQDYFFDQLDILEIMEKWLQEDDTMRHTEGVIMDLF